MAVFKSEEVLSISVSQLEAAVTSRESRGVMNMALWNCRDQLDVESDTFVLSLGRCRGQLGNVMSLRYCAGGFEASSKIWDVNVIKKVAVAMERQQTA